MKVYGPSEIRNLALVGHGHTGKTSLLAAFLHAAGATPELGRVDKSGYALNFVARVGAETMRVKAADLRFADLHKNFLRPI